MISATGCVMAVYHPGFHPAHGVLNRFGMNPRGYKHGGGGVSKVIFVVNGLVAIGIEPEFTRAFLVLLPSN